MTAVRPAGAGALQEGGPSVAALAVPIGATPDGRPRLRSVDAFRGAVLAFMLLTPATGDPAVYPFLRHAPWDGATASDLILPTFLVTSGVSLAFLLRRPVRAETRWRLVRRLVLLVLLGLAYNAYGTTGFDLSSLRYTGVLQMIGVAGFLAAGVVLVTRGSGRDRPVLVASVAVALTALHGVGLQVLADRCGQPDACSPYVSWDRAVLGAEHSYGGGVPGWDPEGIVTSVAATSLVLIGWLVGRRLVGATRDDLPRIAATTAGAGGALLGAAWVLDGFDAANKRLLTPAFVTLAGGVALVGIALFVATFDIGPSTSSHPRLRRVAFPLVSLGRNALVVYLLERFLLQTAATVRLGERSLRAALLDALPGSDTIVHLAYTAALLLAITTFTSALHGWRRYLAL